MDWSKTKTVFIIAFLILDVFLIYQLFEKNKNKIEYISESSIEEKLAAEEITYVDPPKVEIQETYITGKKKHFTKEDFTSYRNQTISFISDHAIVSILDEPLQLSEGEFNDGLNRFLEEYVVSGDSYQYWGRITETNKLLFFQVYKGKPVYFNESSKLSVQLDENNQIIGYEQTLLEGLEEIHDDAKPSILYAEKALESLYNKNYLKSKSHVSSIKLGYYKVVPVSGEVQIFAPTWHIVIDGEQDYFVNAIEGQIN